MNSKYICPNCNKKRKADFPHDENNNQYCPDCNHNIPQKESTPNEPTWKTQNGDTIPYSKLENFHLLNIERYIRKKADEGIEQMGGCPADIDAMWFDTIIGDEVLEYLDHKGILKEINKRKLTPLS